MKFAHAKPNDIPTLTSLLNRSYRGESSRAGWTTEADLLSGKRIDEAGLTQLLNEPDSLILIARTDDTIIATIHVHREGDNVHFGLFAVEPTLQGSGIGKALLDYAERESIRLWKVHNGCMDVISLRPELIRYYERRGYKQTGEKSLFPLSPLWTPQIQDMELIRLSKRFLTTL